ncbi:ABC transporter ATP-binding protein [Ureaplasma canigenitalium]|uniref:ABC transporter ATP-binding protein n=1 Tax=Ureaplasma canigenitalium TaxID=42092 RepID=UPI000A0303C7|nr:ABC transporter ATP-binding protein [Ureaplasma canigenitalium]
MNTAIKIKNLSYKYARNLPNAIDEINLNFFENKFTTVLGPNGCGKSTLAKSIVKLLKSAPGAIKVFDQDISKLSNKKLAQIISYIPQTIEIPQGVRVIDFITYGRNPYLGITGILSKNDKDIINKTIKDMGIESLAHKFMQDLSGGQRQKVILALCLVQDTPIIILDEPTTYLDVKNQYELLESLKHLQLYKNKTIIAILHDLNQAIQYSDYIYVLKDGHVKATGFPDDVITKELLKDVYDIDACLIDTLCPKLVHNIKVKHYIKS